MIGQSGTKHHYYHIRCFGSSALFTMEKATLLLAKKTMIVILNIFTDVFINHCKPGGHEGLFFYEVLEFLSGSTLSF